MTTRTDEAAAPGVTAEAVFARAALYIPEERLGIVREAYEFARDCHEGQFRKSGDPYITHPVAVTLAVAGLELDQNALAAAFLHDVQEDCGVSNDQIRKKFGVEVAKLVDGLTKLDKIPFQLGEGEQPARDSVQAQNLRKMFLAMAEDVRVVLIKLCDRLHNMRTLDAMGEDKQRRIARETIEIFAPLANRLGVWQIKWELEDLSFRYLDPRKYKEIAELLASRRDQREKYIQDATDVLAAQLIEAGIKADVNGRAKHIFSIYQKMERYSDQAKSFDQIYDLLAVRVLVDSVAECYHALGVVHHLWRPLPGQFDDYIANPKDSMYQSLHTTVVSIGGRPLEIQIRTHDMHRVAEYGVAAHWRYKEGGRSGRDEERIAWLRQLLDWQRDLAGAEEFIESVKTDIFHDQVFVFTPKGEVLDLPAGATPLDFAYRIHTDLGHQTVGSKVNGRMVSLNSTIKTGDVVEIMRSRTSKGPSRDWLNPNLGYIRTTHSKEKIRQWFRKQERAENIERGREMLEKEMRRLAVDLSDRQDVILGMFGYVHWEDFLAAVGYGGVSTVTIARRLGAMIQDEEAAAEPPPAMPDHPGPAVLGSPGMRVLGVGNLLTTMASCCRPVPGDQIAGYVTRARGVTVHRADCLNVLNEAERERIVAVEWGTVSRLYPVAIRIEAWDRVGLLRDITTVVTEDKVNMIGVRTIENSDGGVSVLCTLETTGIAQLSRLLSRIEIIAGVRSVERAIEGKRPRQRDVRPRRVRA
ncbi:MAG: RelA/SpoT family protein [Dehalococcoidia bacterium]